MAEQLTIPAIEQRLCTEIENLLVLKPGTLLPEMSLRSLGMDSLRFVSLLIVVEKVFGLSLMKSGLTRQAIQSVRTLAAAIHAGQHS